MIKKRAGSGIFPGWWMVIVTGIISGLGIGFYSQGISVFFKPLAAELNLTRAATSLATGLGRLQGGIEGPLTGWLSDKYGPRWVMVSGLCFAVAGLALMNYISSPWQYYIFWGILIGIGENLALTIALDKALSDWFIAKRGLAIGIRFAIIGVLQVAVVPLVTWLVAAEGWRTTCLIWAGVMSLGIPMSFLFVKPKRPEYYGLLPDGIAYETSGKADAAAMLSAGMEYAESLQEQEYTVRQAMKTSAFWLILIAWSCTTIVMGGFSIHVVPFLTDMGISQAEAAGMLSLMIFFAIPSRFLGGFLADRFKKEHLQYIGSAAVILQAAGLLVFILEQTPLTAYVLLILFGLGNGAVTPIRLAMGGRFFGRKAFASIIGIGMLMNAPLGMLSPIYAGWIFDTTGSYSIAFISFMVLLLASSVVLLFIRLPEPPEQITDIRKFF